MLAISARRLRLLLICLALTSGFAASAPNALAQEVYPSRPIRLLVPFPAGGGSDILARIVAGGMSERLGQPVVVENRPGASTNIAAEAVAKSKPDGYTLLLGNTNTFIVNKLLYSTLPYDAASDFALVGMAGAFPMMLVVPSTSSIKSVAELVDLAKAKSGELSYASPGTGSPHHLAMEMLKYQAKVGVTHIPYKGVAPAIPDLMSERVQMMFIDYAAGTPHIKSGKLRVLAVGSEKPSNFMPDVPTMAASGFPGFDITGWQGIVIPAGAPPDVMRKVTAALQDTLGDPAIQEKLRSAGIDPVYMAPPAFTKHIANERGKLEALIRANNIRLD